MPVEINKNSEESSFESMPDPIRVEESSVAFNESISSVENNNGSETGLSAIEMNDPNSISVTIADPNVPLIILFGPPRCGKTMTLIRLTRYLKKQGYKISPIRTFRPSEDKNYENLCNNFDLLINNTKAAEGTDPISFMLIAVSKNGNPLCQILEAPGEYYFNPKEPNNPFPNYVNTIISSGNRKIWSILVEPDWKNEMDRQNYVTRITSLKQKMRLRDKVLFIYNKIDKTNFVISVGNINTTSAIEDIQNLYPNIFMPFLNQNPITKLFKKYNSGFVPFQTGDYTNAVNGAITYQDGPEEYCENLWNNLLKNIKG
jgi:DNA polymerase III delta prime subunit